MPRILRLLIVSQFYSLAQSFTVSDPVFRSTKRNISVTGLGLAKGQGFGSSSSRKNGKKLALDKTYGKQATGKSTNFENEIIDVNEAMDSFFSEKEEWFPLFRSFLSSIEAPAVNYLLDDVDGFKFTNEGNDQISFGADTPWQQQVPVSEGTDPAKTMVLSTFLDSMQRSLTEIPVDGEKKEDEFDLHFIEEGRRMLVVNRFHVIDDQQQCLFTTVWSELLELWLQNEPNTGSLILLPDFELHDVRRFTEMNLHRPLDWLGVPAGSFEVASLEKGVCGIRIIYKLQGIPDIPQQSSPMTMN